MRSYNLVFSIDSTMCNHDRDVLNFEYQKTMDTIVKSRGNTDVRIKAGIGIINKTVKRSSIFDHISIPVYDFKDKKCLYDFKNKKNLLKTVLISGWTDQ